jgi:hypothetical protein
MRREILSTLCHVFLRNENAKNSFRPAGFIWIISVLDGIGKCLSQSVSNSKEESQNFYSKIEAQHWPDVFAFLKALLHTLAIALTNNVKNQQYFREEINFGTLTDTLEACREMMGNQNTNSGKEILELCECLLNMAVQGN